MMYRLLPKHFLCIFFGTSMEVTLIQSRRFGSESFSYIVKDEIFEFKKSTFGVSETGDLETEVFTDASVPPDGVPHKVRISPKHAGLHRLVGMDGGDNTRYAFPTNMAVAVPVKTGLPDFRSSFSFFVPKGAKSFGFFLKGNGTLVGPDGKVVESFRMHNGHRAIAVPEGADGKAWRISNQIGVFRPLTAPALLNLNPKVLLIPRECR